MRLGDLTCRSTRLMLALALLGLLMFPSSAIGETNFDVIASGLDNPRGLAIGPWGSLYVAEAGIGGEGPCFEGPEGETCYGESGAITWIYRDTQVRIATGLPSLAGRDGTGAGGPQDVGIRRPGVAYTIIGLGGDPAIREDPDILGPVDPGLGYLAVPGRGGRWRLETDVAAYESKANPDGGEVDSNPYGLLTTGTGHLVADAGANALLHVGFDGEIETVAVFANRLVDAPPFLGLPPGAQIPMQSVPTAVAMGPDGAYYVGELTGFPFPQDAARVYRVVPGQAPEIYADGFTNIIDITFDSEGYLYVLEFMTNGLLAGDPTGALIQVAPDGTRTVLASEGLIMPGGVVAADDGTLYVTNCSNCGQGAGQVLRMEMAP